MQRKSIAIVNPIAGTAHSKPIEMRIRQWLVNNGATCEIVLTEYRGHGSLIAKEALQKGYNHFVVVGGDGTLNEVGSQLLNHPEVSLAIVPKGSGNGLSRHLKLPMNTEYALAIAFGYNTIASDV